MSAKAREHRRSDDKDEERARRRWRYAECAFGGDNAASRVGKELVSCLGQRESIVLGAPVEEARLEPRCRLCLQCLLNRPFADKRRLPEPLVLVRSLVRPRGERRIVRANLPLRILNQGPELLASNAPAGGDREWREP